MQESFLKTCTSFLPGKFGLESEVSTVSLKRNVALACTGRLQVIKNLLIKSVPPVSFASIHPIRNGMNIHEGNGCHAL